MLCQSKNTAQTVLHKNMTAYFIIRSMAFYTLVLGKNICTITTNPVYITVKLVFFVCPLFCKFCDLGDFAKIMGAKKYVIFSVLFTSASKKRQN